MAKLVNFTNLLQDAYKNKYAVAHININNLEWIKAVLAAAQEAKAPVIIGVSEGAGKYMNGYKNIVDMVTNSMDFQKITVPVALHLDHGSYDGCKAALAAGFSSVMFDGSSLPVDENVKKTKEIVTLAAKYKASVEGEAGSIGGEEDGKASAGELASLDDCKKLVGTKINALAAGIGNIHGVYPKNWAGLNFDKLKEISSLKVPMVLHGGTGIPLDQIMKAISLGIAKININTECQIAFADATAAYTKANKKKLKKRLDKSFDPRKLLKPGYEAIKQTCLEKFEFFGSKGRIK